MIGLAEAGGEGLALAKEIYAEASSTRGRACAPYAAVIDIDPGKLPTPQLVNGWTAEQYSGALRHDQKNPAFNPHLRQLLHVGYKVAAKMGRPLSVDARRVRAVDLQERDGEPVRAAFEAAISGVTIKRRRLANRFQFGNALRQPGLQMFQGLAEASDTSASLSVAMRSERASLLESCFSMFSFGMSITFATVGSNILGRTAPVEFNCASSAGEMVNRSQPASSVISPMLRKLAPMTSVLWPYFLK